MKNGVNVFKEEDFFKHEVELRKVGSICYWQAVKEVKLIKLNDLLVFYDVVKCMLKLLSLRDGMIDIDFIIIIVFIILI